MHFKNKIIGDHEMGKRVGPLKRNKRLRKNKTKIVNTISYVNNISISWHTGPTWFRIFFARISSVFYKYSNRVPKFSINFRRRKIFITVFD